MSAIVIQESETWAKVPTWVLTHPELSDGAVRCYGVLARYANKVNRLWPSQEDLADRMSRSVRTVKGYMAELRAAGALVERERRRNMTTIWELRLSPPSDMGDQDVQDSAPPTVQDSAPDPDQDVQEPAPLDVQDSAPPIERKNESHITRATSLPPDGGLHVVAEVVDHPTKRRDVLWDALMDACGITPSEITASARGGYNRALKNLRDVGARPEQIHERAEVYREMFRGVVLTPTALAKHWAQLDQRAPADSVGDRNVRAALAWMREQEAQ